MVWQTGSADVSDGASGEHSGVWAPGGLTHRSASDKCRTDSSGLYEPEQIAKLKSYWGTDLPPVERYLNWLKDFLHGNMGTSLLYRRPVAEIIGEKVMNSIWLLFTAWLFSGILGFFLGVLAGKSAVGSWTGS